MRNVSDRHEKLVVAVGFPHEDGVVKIPRSFVIDSDDRQIAQIGSSGYFFLADGERGVRDLPVDRFRKTRAETITEDDGLDLSLRIVGIPDDLHEFSLGWRH